MRIAIAGAGIAGLTTAIAFAARGFAVEVFERAPALEEIGAGIQLSPNAMTVLERLGIAGQLADALVEPQAIEIGDAANGRRLATIPLGAAAGRRYGAPYCLAHRADLQGALLRAARGHPAIALRLGENVREVRESESGLSFAAGSRQANADVLVAADGVYSSLRRAHFGAAVPSASGLLAWRAALPIAEAPAAFSRNVTGLWLAAGAHLVHYPLQGGRSLNVVAIAAEAEPAPTPPRERYGPPVRALIDAVPRWTLWPVFEVDLAGAWARGRVVLIGDAAHAMLPTAAQGGAQAIEDAWVLAEALAAAGGDHPATALTAYERARRPRVERVARAAQRNLALYHLHGYRAAIRDAALRALPARLLLARLDWLYSWQPWVKNR